MTAFDLIKALRRLSFSKTIRREMQDIVLLPVCKNTDMYRINYECTTIYVKKSVCKVKYTR